MKKEPERNLLSASGRVKTVIITSGPTGEPVGIVSEIIAQISPESIPDRITFRGPAQFDSRSLNQLHSIILPIVDQISGHLNIPPKNYEISITNIGAAAATDRGLKISGFSADLPLFMVLLSTSLNIDIRQDIIGTGHIASIDGEIGPVRGIPTKLATALETPGVTEFILPDLERDKSLKVLTPIEYETLNGCLLRYKSAISLHPVKNISEAIAVYFNEECLVSGSLRSGYFKVRLSLPALSSPIGSTISFLCDGNDKRCWDCLSRFLLDRNFEKAKQLLREFVNFHIARQIYPENFGHKLLQLVFSLPPRLREERGLFPLFPIDLYIKISQPAKGMDLEDTQKLYKAIFWEKQSMAGSHELSQTSGDPAYALFESIAAEINKDNLSEKYGRPFDLGRATYIMDTVTIKDGFEFNEVISSFYAHMMRHTEQSVTEQKESAITAGAIRTVTEAFEPKGGYKAALSEGKIGTNGGMRLVFDTMTEYLKRQEIENHINRIFKERVDSLDWDTQVKLMETFMAKIGLPFSEEIRGISTKQLATKWEIIIRYYVESLEKVQNLIKKL